ncbi:MAG: DUF3052 domain-containing protein [Bacteroidota bacterium]
MAGYSGTPLIKKLGIKSDFTIFIQGGPSRYFEWISPLPERIKVMKRITKEQVDFIHLFAVERKTFEKEFITLKKILKKEGILWVSWSKKASKVPTDVDDRIIRVHSKSHRF